MSVLSLNTVITAATGVIAAGALFQKVSSAVILLQPAVVPFFKSLNNIKRRTVPAGIADAEVLISPWQRVHACVREIEREREKVRRDASMHVRAKIRHTQDS